MRPTLPEIKNLLLGDMRSNLGISVSVRNSVLEAISNSYAAVTYLMLVYIDSLLAQVLPADATGRALDSWGDTINLPRKAATFATATVTFKGTLGADVLAGSQVRSGGGYVYQTIADGTLAGVTPQAEIEVRSILAGSTYNIANQDVFLSTSIAGIASSAAFVLANPGENSETDQVYSARVRNFFRRSAYGAGSDQDFISWATAGEATRAWVVRRYNKIGNQVGIFVLKAGNEPLLPAEILAVESYIASRKPVIALPVVVTPEVQKVDISIQMRLNTADIRAEVGRNLSRLFLAAHVRGSTDENSLAQDGVVYISQIREAISAAAGEIDNIVTSPDANVAPTKDGAILALGETTFSTLEK